MGGKLWLVFAVISVNRKDLGIVSGIPFPEALLYISNERMKLIYNREKKKKHSLLPPVTNIQKWSKFIIWNDQKNWGVVDCRRRIIKNSKSMLPVHRKYVHVFMYILHVLNSFFTLVLYDWVFFSCNVK